MANPFETYTFQQDPENADNVYQVLRGDFYVGVQGGNLLQASGNFYLGAGAERIHVSQLPIVEYVPAVPVAGVRVEVGSAPAAGDIENKICAFVDHSNPLQGGLQEAQCENGTTYPQCIYKRDAAPIVVTQNSLLYYALQKAITLIPEAGIEAFVQHGIPAGNRFMNIVNENQLLYNGGPRQINGANAPQISKLNLLHPLIIILLLENQNVIVNNDIVNAILTGLTQVQRATLLRYNMSQQLLKQYLQWMGTVEAIRNPRTMADLTGQLLRALVARTTALDNTVAQIRAQLQQAQANLAAAGPAAEVAAAALQGQIDAHQATIDRLTQEIVNLNGIQTQLREKLSDYQYMYNGIFGSLQNVYTTSKGLVNVKYGVSKQTITNILSPQGANQLAFVGGVKKRYYMRKMKGGEATPKTNNLNQIYNGITSNNSIDKIKTSIDAIQNQQSLIKVIKEINTYLQNKNNQTTLSKAFYKHIGKIHANLLIENPNNSSNINIETAQKEALKNNSSPSGNGNTKLGANPSAVVTTSSPGNGINQSAVTTSSRNGTNTSALQIAQQTITEMVKPENIQTILEGLDESMKTINNNTGITNKLKSKHQKLNETTQKIIKNSEANISNNKITSKTKLKAIFKKYFQYLQSTNKSRNNIKNNYLPKINQTHTLVTSEINYTITFKGLPDSVNKEITTSLDVEQILNEVLQEMSSPASTNPPVAPNNNIIRKYF